MPSVDKGLKQPPEIISFSEAIIRATYLTVDTNIFKLVPFLKVKELAIIRLKDTFYNLIFFHVFK